jgi:hypothetical protein
MRQVLLFARSTAVRTLLLMPVLGSAARAQLPLSPGARVRLARVEKYDVRRTGNVVSASQDSAVVDFDPVPEIELRRNVLQVSRAQLEVLTATRRYTAPVALLLGTTAAITGRYIGGRSFGNLCEGSPAAGFTCSKDTSMATPLLVFGAVTGAGVGAIIGHLWKSETWEPVNRPR